VGKAFHYALSLYWWGYVRKAEEVGILKSLEGVPPSGGIRIGFIPQDARNEMVKYMYKSLFTELAKARKEGKPLQVVLRDANDTSLDLAKDTVVVRMSKCYTVPGGDCPYSESPWRQVRQPWMYNRLDLAIGEREEGLVVLTFKYPFYRVGRGGYEHLVGGVFTFYLSSFFGYWYFDGRGDRPVFDRDGGLDGIILETLCRRSALPEKVWGMWGGYGYPAYLQDREDLVDASVDRCAVQFYP
jgi:hypothetical protein